MTGSTHANHRSAPSPRPTTEGSARDNTIAGPERVRRGASPAPLPRRGPAAGTISLVLGRPPPAPRSRPVKPGAQAPGLEKGTTVLGKPTGARRATGPDEARRTTRGHKARQTGTPPATTRAHKQVPSNNGRRSPPPRRARTTHDEPRHGRRSPGSRAPTPASRTNSQWKACPGRTPEGRAVGRGRAPNPWTPHTQARCNPPPPGRPPAAPTARKARSQERALWGR